MRTLDQITKIEKDCEFGKYDEEYAKFIMDNGDPSEITVCNGDTLIGVMESGYMYEEFVNFMIEKLLK